MRLRIIGGSDTEQTGVTPHSADFTPGAPIETSHALVPVEPVIAETDTPEAFREAPFLTQLLAIRDQHPQTRLYCRAEPRVALAAYRNTATLTEH